VTRFARLAVDWPETVESEQHPLIANPAALVAVDARDRPGAGGADGHP
jgi:hypothetical protein